MSLLNKLSRHFPNVRVKNLSKQSSCRHKSYYITSPIFYVNAPPHIGHLYSVLLGDAQRRFQILKGRDAFLGTGTDEHGLKIQQAADKANKEPSIFCNDISNSYLRCFKHFDVGFADYVRTTEQRHARAVAELWQRLVKGEYIYKDVYESWYCVQDESFLTEHQVELKPDGSRVSLESCHPVEWAQEENYVFRLNQFKERIKNWLEENRIIQPAVFHNHLIQLLSTEELPDLSVSRSRDRLHWGIPVPNDSSQTIYVWLDALANYLTMAGFPDQFDESLWPPDCHVVGKDILKFHAIFWPAFLMAADLPLPKKILCHSHWMVDDNKMSKSKGNIVDPMKLSEQFTTDGVRYFLLREGTPHSDGNFSLKKMTNYLNSELANTLGNLLNRTTSNAVNVDQMFYSHDPQLFAAHATDECREISNSLRDLPAKVSRHYEEFDFYLGIDLIMESLRKTNTYIQNAQPWVLKTKDTDRLKVVLHTALQSLRISGILLQPIVPNLSANLLNKLNLGKEFRTWKNAETFDLNDQGSKSHRLSDENLVLFRKIK